MSAPAHVVAQAARPGGPLAGVLICAALALMAQGAALGAGLVWDDAVLLGTDPRVRDLSFVFTSFRDSFFGDLADNEMYRPLVNASLALDWFLSGSAPGKVAAGWFHFVNLCLHAANAGLVFLLLAHVTRRSRGAPLLAAALFAVHPLAVEPTTWIVGRCDLLAGFFGLSSAVLLMRSPGKPQLLWASVLFYGVALFAKASAAMLPVVVVLALVAFHGVEPKRAVGRRILGRLAWFTVPAVIWLVARIAVLGAPFPRGAGLRWHHVDFCDGALGVGRSLWIYSGHLLLPVRLCGDYAGDLATTPGMGGVTVTGTLGLLGAAAVLLLGLRFLRSHPKAAFPLLAALVTLVPVLQVVPIGAIVADRFLYLPMAFALLLVGEGLERVFHRYGGRQSLGLMLGLVVLLGTLSRIRAPAWEDDVAFNRGVIATYTLAPRAAVHRLAVALDERDGPGDAAEARRLLRFSVSRLKRPDDELCALGAMLVDDGELEEAESILRRGVTAAGGKRWLGGAARYNLAVALHRQGRDDEALALLDEALELRPRLAAARALRTRLRDEP